MRRPILALAGGVGGARLASGLAQVLPADELVIVVNVGDDFDHLGLTISPDLDTVMYTLAGVVDRQKGWGRAAESWNFMAELETLGGETWFRLGDKDLAVHIERTRRLKAGESLSEVTAYLCARFGVQAQVVPVSDSLLRTRVETDAGDLAFQDYFVRRQCGPAVRSVRFDGAGGALPSPSLRRLVEAGGPRGVIICPSNPWLSIAPILSVPMVRDLLTSGRVPVVGVSPIVGGAAVKGPAAKIMAELGLPVSTLGVAEHYGRLVHAWLIDHADAGLRDQIASQGFSVAVDDTLMTSTAKAREVACSVLRLLQSLGANQ